MTQEEFMSIRLGDKIRDKKTGEVGEVVVLSVGEPFVQFPSNPDMLVSYDPLDYGGDSWLDIEFVK